MLSDALGKIWRSCLLAFLGLGIGTRRLANAGDTVQADVISVVLTSRGRVDSTVVVKLNI